MSDLRRVAIADDVWAVVGWIDRPGEVGPTCSVFADDIEVLRCDLFEHGPHIHPLFAATHGADLGTMRWQPPTPAIGDLIDWVRREVAVNLDVHLRAVPDACRRPEPSEDQRRRAADRIADELREVVRSRAARPT
ncbi:hypothetical protein BDK89_3465 [Ilumatobacter fluminis]|uniref:Uncharacterized protein n=1 Tax=Ilumatobacter fluminis TaxID=467091 RepID=A0A4R7I2L7_9ACTN|nr:hypothetical protein [Ilumatobacter fluminis]TDT17852.1 hypothetical protein BDK89_3465 [Ilumatobacter fluminis]